MKSPNNNLIKPKSQTYQLEMFYTNSSYPLSLSSCFPLTPVLVIWESVREGTLKRPFVSCAVHPLSFSLWNKGVIFAHPLSLSHFKRLRVLRDSIGRRIKWRCISLFQKERSPFLSHKRLLMGTHTPDINILSMVRWFKEVH